MTRIRKSILTKRKRKTKRKGKYKFKSKKYLRHKYTKRKTNKRGGAPRCECGNFQSGQPDNFCNACRKKELAKRTLAAARRTCGKAGRERAITQRTPDEQLDAAFAASIASAEAEAAARQRSLPVRSPACAYVRPGRELWGRCTCFAPPNYYHVNDCPDCDPFGRTGLKK